MGKKNRRKRDRIRADELGRTYRMKGGKRYYSERSGGNSGRVQKDQFSIDGRAFDYRDPRNEREIERANSGRERGRTVVNPQSIAKFNALYDYDFGTVRDAAKELGIGNVDEKKEVRKILEYIQGGGKKKESKSEKPKPQPKREIKIPDSPYDRPTKPPGQPGQPDDNTPPPGSIHYNPSPLSAGSSGDEGKDQLTDALARVADFGNRARDDYFGRFLPEMEQRNINESEEMTRNTLIAIRDFVGKVPEPGDPKELFKYYKKKIS
tara:strand:- start:5939 stop:6733 length:795 start_codon:yes stop_codon:yes gene_type:complete